MSCAKQCWAPFSSPFHFLLRLHWLILNCQLSQGRKVVWPATGTGPKQQQQQIQQTGKSLQVCHHPFSSHYFIRPCSILLLGFSMLPFRLLFMLYFPIHSQYFVLQATYRQNQNSSQSQQWINSEEKENCSQQQVFSKPMVNLWIWDTWRHWAP